MSKVEHITSLTVKFCMQIADSAKEASISMGEGGLDGEKTGHIISSIWLGFGI